MFSGDRSLAEIGGAERPLASAGRAGGVSGGWSSRSNLGWLDAAYLLLRRLDGREDPWWEAGGSCGCLEEDRQDRLGEVSGDESSISIGMG